MLLKIDVFCFDYFKVIEEIEEIMQDSSEMESEQNTSLSEFSVISQKTQRSHTSHVYKESEYFPPKQSHLGLLLVCHTTVLSLFRSKADVSS